MSSGSLSSSDRVLFVADQFSDVDRDEVHKYPGGAELTDQAVIEAAPCSVQTRTFAQLTERDLSEATAFVIGNSAKATTKQLLRLARLSRVILFEHDMRICRVRGDMTFWKRPLHRHFHWCTCKRSDVLTLTRASAGVMFLTRYQQGLFERNPWYTCARSRVLGSSVFSSKTLDEFRQRPTTKERPIDVCLSYSAFSAKGFSQSMRYARRVSDDPFVIRNLPPNEVLEEFLDSKRFVHLPPSPEWAGRLPVEARFMGCKVITNDRVGVALEPWWQLPDDKALSVLSSAATRFWSLVDEMLSEDASA